MLDRVLTLLREGAVRWPADELLARLEQRWELGLALRQHVEPWGLLGPRVRVARGAHQNGQVTLSREFRLAPPPP